MLWTQRHVRVQLSFVMLVLLLTFVMKLEALKVLFVVSAVTAVLMAELFNTAIEVVVNMITKEYHPLAKIAKDVAAAGVLIASIYATIVGITVFLNTDGLKSIFRGIDPKVVQPEPLVIIGAAVVIVSILVALAKVRVGHGTILRGGAVSGHTAVAFLLFAAIFIYSNYNPLISILALTIAVLVAQSRVEGKIHTLAEVLWGATVALALMALLMVFAKFG